MVDDKRLGMSAGSYISYLSEEEQRMVLKFILEFNVKISKSQASELKELHFRRVLDEVRMQEVLFAVKLPSKRKENIVFGKEIYDYFSEDYGPDQIKETILAMLNGWMKSNEEV